MQDLASFTLAGVALTGSPGPATLGLAAAGAAFGIRRSLALLAGILVGVLVVMMVTATGLTGLVLAQPGAGPRRERAGRGVHAVPRLPHRHGAAAGETSPSERPPGFGPGLFLGLRQPQGLRRHGRLVSGFVLCGTTRSPMSPPRPVMLLAIMIAVDVVWLLVGSALTRAFRRRALGRAINVGFAVLLVASVAWRLRCKQRGAQGASLLRRLPAATAAQCA